MPKKSPSATEKPEPVYEFFYTDERRVASLLSQFLDHGAPTEITHSDLDQKKASSGFNAQIGASSPLLGGFNIGGGKTPSTSGSESVSRKYDPLWLNALALMSFLEQKDLISEDIKTVPLGTIVKCSGPLIIIDTSFAQSLYKADWMIQHSKEKNNISEENLDSYREFLFHLEIMQSTTPQIQAMILKEDTPLFGTLRPDGLSTPAEELCFKHGNLIGGLNASNLWHMIAIKDATAERSREHIIAEHKQLQTLFNNPFHHEIIEVNGIRRMAFGRPEGAIGVTPLAIFRELSRA